MCGRPEQVEGLVLARHGNFTFSNRTEVETRALTQKWGGTGNVGTRAHANFFCFHLLSEIEKEGRKWDCKLTRAGNFVTIAPRWQTQC